MGCALLVVCLSGCNRQDAQFQEYKESFESLGSTTAAIANAWLAGEVSGTYAATALEKTLFLVEQQRAAVAQTPKSLHDPRGAYLSQAGERLSRVIADLSADVSDADGASVRRHVAAIPIAPPRQP